MYHYQFNWKPVICFHTVWWLNSSISNNSFNLACHLLALSLNVKQFYLTHRSDPIRRNHYGTKWTWLRWDWRSTPQSQKLHYYRSLTIRLFSVISWTLVGWRGLTPQQRCIRCILQPQETGLVIVWRWFQPWFCLFWFHRMNTFFIAISSKNKKLNKTKNK